MDSDKKIKQNDHDFMQMMDAFQIIRNAIDRKREFKKSGFTEQDQLEAIEDVIKNVPTGNAFLMEDENGNSLDDKVVSAAIHEFIQHRKETAPEIRPPYHIGELQKFLKNPPEKYKKDDNTKKVDNFQEVANKIENEETDFKESPKYHETILAILENTLEETKDGKPNPSMYYWASQQLIHSKELTVELIETPTEKKIKFAVVFPGVSREFKTVCFKNQRDVIAAKTNARDLFELDRKTAAASGGPTPQATEETINKYNDFTKNPISQFYDFKQKIFPEHDVNQPIIGIQQITENRNIVAAIVNSLRDTPCFVLEDTKDIQQGTMIDVSV